MNKVNKENKENKENKDQHDPQAVRTKSESVMQRANGLEELAIITALLLRDFQRHKQAQPCQEQILTHTMQTQISLLQTTWRMDWMCACLSYLALHLDHM